MLGAWIRASLLADVAGDLQHYLPAGLIGRFGKRSGKRWRTAHIAVRQIGGSGIGQTTAKRVAFEKGLYRLKSPPDGLDADAVDRIWTILEQQLPNAIESLARGALRPDEEQTLLFYIASCAVRHPDVFRRVAGAHQKSLGLPEPTGDSLQVIRLQSVQATLTQVTAWRWRIFETSLDAPRLVINDKGFCYLADTSRQTSGLFLPLTPTLGVFGSLGDDETTFAVRRRLTDTSVRWVNHLLWLEAPREVYGHPEDFRSLEQLDEIPPVNQVGPFMWRHGGGWFD